MSTTSQPVTQTNSPILKFERWMDWLVEGLEQDERAARKRWKKQISKQFTRCLDCNAPLVSKWETLRGTNDPEKALCSACKVIRKDAAKAAKREARIEQRKEAYERRNRDRYINKLDARYVGPDTRRKAARPAGPYRMPRMGGDGIHTPVGSLATSPRPVKHAVDVNDRPGVSGDGRYTSPSNPYPPEEKLTRAIFKEKNWCPDCKECVQWNHEHHEQLV